jgi:magnesium transporter
MRQYYRDVYDHLHRTHQPIDAIRDMVGTAIQVNLGMISLSENEVTKRLAAYGALITIPTLIAGIYGMNFEHMPELKSIFGYPVALGVMVAIDAVLFWKFRRAGWI